ncbi:MAG: hypothetical protein WKG06_08595 [Segetibacter sp.]
MSLIAQINVEENIHSNFIKLITNLRFDQRYQRHLRERKDINRFAD